MTAAERAKETIAVAALDAHFTLEQWIAYAIAAAEREAADEALDEAALIAGEMSGFVEDAQAKRERRERVERILSLKSGGGSSREGGALVGSESDDEAHFREVASRPCDPRASSTCAAPHGNIETGRGGWICSRCGRKAHQGEARDVR